MDGLSTFWFGGPEDGPQLGRLVRRHGVLRKIEVFLPLQHAKAPVPPASREDHGMKLSVGSVHLAKLLTPSFLAQRKDALLVVASYGNRLDTDNSFVLYPDGKLFISVDQSTFQGLGLQGRRCKHTVNPRFMIEFDMNTISNKNRDTIQWALGEERSLPVQFIAARFSKDTLEPLDIEFPTGTQYKSFPGERCEEILRAPLPVFPFLPSEAEHEKKSNSDTNATSEPELQHAAKKQKTQKKKEKSSSNNDKSKSVQNELQRLEWAGVLEYFGALACRIVLDEITDESVLTGIAKAAPMLNLYDIHSAVDTADVPGFIQSHVSEGMLTSDHALDAIAQCIHTMKISTPIVLDKSAVPPLRDSLALGKNLAGGNAIWGAVLMHGWHDLPHIWNQDRDYRFDGANDMLVLFFLSGHFVVITASGDKAEQLNF